MRKNDVCGWKSAENIWGRGKHNGLRLPDRITFRAGRRKFSEGIKGEVRRGAEDKLPTMPASSFRALTRSEADLLIAQMQEQLRLMQAARPATPAPETQPDPREESGSESESEESEEEEVAPAPPAAKGS